MLWKLSLVLGLGLALYERSEADENDMTIPDRLITFRVTFSMMILTRRLPNLGSPHIVVKMLDMCGCVEKKK